MPQISPCGDGTCVLDGTILFGVLYRPLVCKTCRPGLLSDAPTGTLKSKQGEATRERRGDGSEPDAGGQRGSKLEKQTWEGFWVEDASLQVMGKEQLVQIFGNLGQMESGSWGSRGPGQIRTGYFLSNCECSQRQPPYSVGTFNFQGLNTPFPGELTFSFHECRWCWAHIAGFEKHLERNHRRCHQDLLSLRG